MFIYLLLYLASYVIHVFVSVVCFSFIFFFKVLNVLKCWLVHIYIHIIQSPTYLNVLKCWLVHIYIDMKKGLPIYISTYIHMCKYVCIYTGIPLYIHIYVSIQHFLYIYIQFSCVLMFITQNHQHSSYVFKRIFLKLMSYVFFVFCLST